MIEKISEFFLGDKEEQIALKTTQRLGSKLKRTSREQQILEQANGVSRRIFLRRFGSLGTTVVLAAIGFALMPKRDSATELQDILRDESDEQTYNYYLHSFESVVGDDQEVKSLLAFFKERRKRTKLFGSWYQFLMIEQIDPEYYFASAVVDPVKNKEVFQRMQGFAEYSQQMVPTYLFLKKVPIDSVWAGVLLAHESLHIYQWLSGIEQSREDGFIQGEQEAYDLEVRLLDQVTGGRFKQIIDELASQIPHGSHLEKLNEKDLPKIDSLFNPPLSKNEENMRLPVYVLALNFAAVEQRSTSLGEAKKEKVEYFRQVYEGKLQAGGELQHTRLSR